MAAHWVVIAAAALTTLVAAAAGSALAVFAGQALPQAVQHDLTVAPGNSLAAAGPFGTGDARSTTALLKSSIGRALPAVPFDFWTGTWSDPLGLVRGALPARPSAVASGATPLLEAAALGGITSHAVLVSGEWPTASGTAVSSRPTVAIPAALPATSAALLHLRVGDVLRLTDRNTNARLTFTITGLFAQRQQSGTAAAYWQLDPLPASGSTTASGFITYGPLIVPPTAFGGALVAASGTWVAQPDMASVTDGELSSTSASITALETSMNNSNALSGMQLTSNLPRLLADIGSNLALARSLLAISGLQLLVLTVAALLAVARLLATQREGETALLIARGATRWQLTRLTAAEVVPLAVASALAGGAAGVWLARWLGGSLYGTGITGRGAGISLTAGATWTDALAATVLIVVLGVGTLLYPVLRPPADAARPGAGVRRGRQAALARLTRAGADLGLIALAVLAGWQLRRYSAVATSATGAPAAIDPVLALAPALALAGGTVLTLRLLPAAARATDRLAASGRRLTPALAGWQFSRQPLRQGGAALLIVMAVATGTLALAQHESWVRSTTDQAAFTTGADARVDLPSALPPARTASLTHAPGVTDAMAAVDDLETLPAPILAVNSARAAGVVQLRGGESPRPAARLFGAIAPTSAAGGTALAGHPSAIRLTATLSQAPIGAVSVLITVTDAAGGTFQLPVSGTVPADGRPHRLTAPLGGTGFAYPLRITQLTASYAMPKEPDPHGVTLTITGAAFAGWSAVASAPELASAGASLGPSASPAAATLQPVSEGATITFDPGFGETSSINDLFQTIYAPATGQVTLTAGHLTPSAVPAIATQAFDDANHTSPGRTVSATVNGITIPVRIVAQVSTFPTVAGSGLIMDLTTLQSVLAANSGAPLMVTQWWLATAGHDVPAALTAALPTGSDVTSRATVQAATAGDPLSAAPQQALLAIAAAAALLAITGFVVSIASNVRQRRAENALLAALGVAQRSAAAQLFMEKLLLSVPAAALGLVLGTVVARLLVPAVTLTTTAQAPVPPAVTLFDLSQTITLAAAVAVLPVLAAALVVFRRPDPAAELRAAEAA